MNFLWVFILLLCSSNIGCNHLKRVKRIVGGIVAAAPPLDDPVVFVKQNGRHARIEGFRSDGVYSFLGIRFAYAPIGENRFRRPHFKYLEGDINATIYGDPCPQPDSSGFIIGSEDCLWLNVFTPQMPDESTGLPVIVWIHGGGYRYGSANQYTATSITSKNVIFVPIQYRLGSLGIFGDGSSEYPGNAALFDMAAALRWVHEYIKFFGGSQEIIIMGHGSGAIASEYLATTQRSSRSMVNGVIAMSGTLFSPDAVDDAPIQSTEEIALANKCPYSNGMEMIKCLRESKFQDIIQEDSKIQIERMQRVKMRSIMGNTGYQPVIENPPNQRSLPGFIEENPRNTIENGKFQKIPLLTGVTKDETAGRIDVKQVTKLFGSSAKFLDSLISTLRTTNLIQQMVDIHLPGVGKTLNLSEYLKLPKHGTVEDIAKKLAEATTDALFALPAILTAQLWSKVTPVYLYSFEYVGKKNVRDSGFLNGLPIAETKPAYDAVSHGDELIYLFNAHDIFGNRIQNQELVADQDKKVRENFSNLISTFAYMNRSKNTGIFEEFQIGQSNYLTIGTELMQRKDFRYCQLALWGAPVKPSSKKTTCVGLLNQLTEKLLKKVTNITGLTNGLF